MEKCNISVAVFLNGIPTHISKKYDIKHILKENKGCPDTLIYELYGNEYIAVEIPHTGTGYNRSIVNERRKYTYIFKDFIVIKKDNINGKYIDITRDDIKVLNKLIEY